MTALVYALQPDQVCVAMDTLVVGAEDRLPLAFQRKFLLLPASDLLIAGTGIAEFINGWFTYLQALIRLGDVEDLNRIAPAVLKSSADAAGGLGAQTTTLYHFGYSRSRQRYVGYAYRSINDFRSEQLQDVLGFKPEVPVEPTDNIQFPEFLIDIIVRQQQFDRSLPASQQVGIGGEIEFVVLANRTTQIETVHRFFSYERESEHIRSRSGA